MLRKRARPAVSAEAVPPGGAATAERSPLNEQVAAAAGAADGFVLAAAPREARALGLQAFAHATALAMANAVQAQGGMQQVNKAATAAMVAQIMQAGAAVPARTQA